MKMEEYDTENGYDYQYEEEQNYEEESIRAQEEMFFFQEKLETQSKGKDFNVVSLEELYSQIIKKVEEVKSIVYLEDGWCLLLLNFFKWNPECLKEKFYDNREAYLYQIGFKYGFVPLTQLKKVQGKCLKCLQQNVPLLPNICNDKFCQKCWIKHLTSSIDQSMPFMKCINKQCNCPILHEIILKTLMPSSEYAKWITKYEKRLCEFFIIQHQNYKFCIAADCNNCLRLNNQKIDIVRCTCSQIFCFKCQAEDHSPCTCQQKTQWIQQVLHKDFSHDWIKQNTRICPWCKQAVQIVKGKRYISCICGETFFIVCQQNWNFYNHLGCSIVQEFSNQKEQSLKKWSQQTEKYLLAQTISKSLKGIDVFAKIKLIFEIFQIPLAESNFLKNAYQIAMECCERSKWIYAFIYFTEIKNKSQEENLNESLSDYEQHKDNLLHILTEQLVEFENNIRKAKMRDAIDYEMVTIYLESWKSLKERIIDALTYFKKYQRTFVDMLKQLRENVGVRELEQYQEVELAKEISSIKIKKNSLQIMRNDEREKKNIKKKEEEIHQLGQ